MIVLGIDTSTLTGSVAVVRDASVLATEVGKGHGASLLPMIDTACRRAGIAPRELEAVAIGAGPGSFTGLRIGMATAKGIAFAARCPLWAVSSLAAIAHDALPDDGEVVVALDARRGEVFAARYRREHGRLIGASAECVVSPHEVATWTAPRFAGDAVDVYPELAARPWSAVKTPSATAVVTLALAGDRADVLVSGVPAYLRRAEAEIKYPDGVPGALRKRP